MMNSILKLFCAVFLFAACSSAPKGPQETKVAMQLKAWEYDKISILNDDRREKQQIGSDQYELSEDGKVSLTAKIDRHVLLGVNFMFSLYLEPGDNLSVDADVTEKGAGLKLKFTGKGHKNNEALYTFMNIYYKHFPQGISFFREELKADEIIGKYNAAKDAMVKFANDSKGEISENLYNYMCAYTGTIMPGQLMGTIGYNTYDDKDKIYSAVPDLNNMQVLGDGYYDINYSYYIKLLLNNTLKNENKAYASLNKEEKFDLEYNKAKSLLKDEQVKESFLNYHIGGGINLVYKNKVEGVRPYIDDFQKMFPKGEKTASLNKYYNLMLKLAVGKYPPEISLKDIEGNDFSLSSLKGKIVYVDFWASWCGPCRNEMKKGAPGLHEKFKDNKDLVFVYVSIDQKEDAWKKAIKEDNIQGIHLRDANEEVAQKYGISGVPHYFIIGKDGKIVNNDAPRPTNDYTVELLESLLAK